MSPDIEYFLELVGLKGRVYLSLRYGINPWGIHMKPIEIARLLGISKQALNTVARRTEDILTSRRGSKVFLEYLESLVEED